MAIWPEKRCVECGAEWTPRTRYQASRNKTCSHKCAAAAVAKSVAARPKARPLTYGEVDQYINERSDWVTESGCRIWLGHETRGRGAGYGMLTPRIGRQFGTAYVHRIAYLMAHGAIPDGREVDHKCNVRACSNPDHLQALTHLENVKRAAKSCVTVNMSKTHCRKGHPLFGSNLKVMSRSSGGVFRQCLTCLHGYGVKKWQEVLRRRAGEGQACG